MVQHRALPFTHWVCNPGTAAPRPCFRDYRRKKKTNWQSSRNFVKCTGSQIKQPETGSSELKPRFATSSKNHAENINLKLVNADIEIKESRFFRDDILFHNRYYRYFITEKTHTTALIFRT